ncbi:MAG: hypothetical protein ACOC8F_00430 [Planctomycetota bacterium]
MNRFVHILTTTLLGALVCAVASCGPALGLLTYWANPPQTVKAVCELPDDKRICVFVEDAPFAGSRPLARMLTSEINAQLERNDVAAETVPYGELLELAAVMPDYSTTSVLELARRVDADLLVEVSVTEFSLRYAEAGQVWKGQLGAVVEARRVDTGRRLGPGDDPEGYHVEPVELPMTSSADPHYGDQLTRELTARMADRIAKLFYDHKVRPADRQQ